MRADAGIHQIADLAGRRINVGEQGSGTHATWDALQPALGWSDAQTPQTTDFPTDIAARSLCDGHIDANLLVVGHPSASVRTQLAMCAKNFVAVSQPIIDALVARAPYLVEANISGALYGRTEDTPSIGVNAVLVTSANADAKAVVTLSQATITHRRELGSKFPALAHLTVEKMTSGNTPAPLYPAANDLFSSLRRSK